MPDTRLILVADKFNLDGERTKQMPRTLLLTHDSCLPASAQHDDNNTQCTTRCPQGHNTAGLSLPPPPLSILRSNPRGTKSVTAATPSKYYHAHPPLCPDPIIHSYITHKHTHTQTLDPTCMYLIPGPLNRSYIHSPLAAPKFLENPNHIFSFPLSLTHTYGLRTCATRP